MESEEEYDLPVCPGAMNGREDDLAGPGEGAMWLDDLFLRLQSGLDRLIRRARVGVPPERTRRRFVVIQIDGPSATVLDRALAEGRMPFLRGLLARHGYRRQPMAVGLPTSTPAFQMAALYGVRPDIPGYHYHDKRRGMDIHFPRAGHPLELYDLLIQ